MILILNQPLARFDHAVEIVVTSDASRYSVEAILLNRYKDGNMKVMVHASSALIATETKTKNLQSDKEQSSSDYFCCKEISQISP